MRVVARYVKLDGQEVLGDLEAHGSLWGSNGLSQEIVPNLRIFTENWI